MSGRGRPSRHAISPRRLSTHPHPSYPYSHGPGPYSHRPGPSIALRSQSSILAEEIERRDAELRVLLSDRRVLAGDRLALQRELVDKKDELNRASLRMEDIKAERERYIGSLVEKGLRLERELRDSEMLREEVKNLRVDIERHAKGRMELGMKIDMLKKDITVAGAENKKMLILRDELDGINQMLIHTRNAAEMEKKANMTMVEQKASMEKNMVKMSREIDKLRAELANSEGGRPWGPPIPPVGGPYGSVLGSPPAPFPPSYPHLDISERGSSYGSGSDHNRHSYR
ncbi:hypothetical protein LUZ60_015563 [Juncus effusus]|nr:hypothetical protein LUZ60_015563 [Juncus effusus]